LKIIDNFLPKKQFKEIKETVTYSLPWYYSRDVGIPKAGDLYYLMHMFYRENEVQSNFYHPVIKPLIDIIKPLSLIRAKGNLYPSTHKIYRHEEHVDYSHSHKGFLYYINTNNGFTILENGKKVESIANRALFFDSSKMHQSTTCTDQNIRINININYI
jgi:hypothetical protein|tara:strand:+ start:76 stop:552 length:477 start_codon:yes stop_codon:yes gene_type:complete